MIEPDRVSVEFTQAQYDALRVLWTTCTDRQLEQAIWALQGEQAVRSSQEKAQ